MIIYIEKQAKQYPQTTKIVKQFPRAHIVEIDHYKNIFDKYSPDNASLKPHFVVAKLQSPVLTPAPPGYGYNDTYAYFLKTSLNCIFDCQYCFLKGAFRNDIPVYFVNYDDIKQEIITHLTSQDLPNTSSYDKKFWLYTGDYSDILGANHISGFVDIFVPFFEKLGSQYPFMAEIRTKSTQINDLLHLGFVPKYTEIAFSLNPQELIKKYEKGTASLDKRIETINTLLQKGYKVGLRFLPLLPVKNYKSIYTKFVHFIAQKINMTKIFSTFASGLLYTKKDYKKILQKYPDLDLLYYLQKDDEYFVREHPDTRAFFYQLFKQLDKKCFICLDKA